MHAQKNNYHASESSQSSRAITAGKQHRTNYGLRVMFARSELTAVVKDEETPLPLPFLIHKANPSPRQASSGGSAWQVSHT